MFNVSCKDPLDAEKIGERRQRKHKEIQEEIDSINEAVRRGSASSTTLTPASPTSGFSPVLSRNSSKSSIASRSPRIIESPQSISSFFRDPFSVRARPARSSPAPTPGTSKKGRSPELDAAIDPSRGQARTSSSVIKAEEFYNLDGSTASSTTFSRVPSYTNYPIPSNAPDPEAIHSKHCQRLLHKIEMSNDKTTSSRLAERWPMEHGDNIDMIHEFHFETALYSLVCTQKLCSRRLSGPSEDDVVLLPLDLHPLERARLLSGNILHMGATRGSPESWYLGAKLPDATIHSLGLKTLPFDISSSYWNLPPNVLLEQWPEFPQLDYADAVLDAVIISHHLFESVRCTLWPLLVEQISRVLAPGGILTVSVMDVQPQQSGPLLDNWIHDNVYTNVLRRFMVPCPSLLVPSWLEENGSFVEEKIHRDHFPCMPACKLRVDPFSPSNNVKSPNDGGGSGRGRKKSFRHHRSSLAEQLDEIDVSAAAAAVPALPALPEVPAPSAVATPAPSSGTQEQLLATSVAGWIHYQRLYADFLPPIHALGDPHEDEKLKLPDMSRDWWLGDEQVCKECDRTKPFFEMVTFVYRRVREAYYDDGDGDGD